MNDLPNGWHFSRLDEVATIVRGVTYSSKDVLGSQTTEAIRLLRATNIQNGALDQLDPVWIPRTLVKPQQVLEPGDVVIASSSGSIQVVGKSAMVKAPMDATFGAFCTTVRATNVLPAYLAFYLQDPSLRQKWSDLASGSNINNLKTTDIAATFIPVPPLEEQKRIVEALDDHLSRLDKALGDLGNAASQSLVFRRSILNQLVNPQLSETDSKAYRTVLLRDLVDVLDSKRIPLSASERKHRQGVVPYFGATGQVGTIDVPIFDEPLVLLGEDGVQFFDPYKPKAYKIKGPSWVNNHAHVLRPNPELVEFDYLFHYLNAIDYQGFANGTTRLKLTQGAMNSIPVMMPDLSEQRRLVRILERSLESQDAARRAIASQTDALQTLRRSLLNKAFRGELGTDHL